MGADEVAAGREFADLILAKKPLLVNPVGSYEKVATPTVAFQ